MRPEFITWLSNLAETFGKGFAIFCIIAAVSISIFGVCCAIEMQKAEQK